jgi:hypothetical protein
MESWMNDTAGGTGEAGSACDETSCPGRLARQEREADDPLYRQCTFGVRMRALVLRATEATRVGVRTTHRRATSSIVKHLSFV